MNSYAILFALLDNGYEIIAELSICIDVESFANAKIMEGYSFYQGIIAYAGVDYHYIVPFAGLEQLIQIQVICSERIGLYISEMIEIGLEGELAKCISTHPSENLKMEIQ